MFDLLKPVTKLAYSSAFIAIFLGLNVALLYVTSACLTSTACIGTGNLASVATMVQRVAGSFLPTNFYACVQCIIVCYTMRRAYDYAVKVADTTAKTA
jgi:hypothetical protein